MVLQTRPALAFLETSASSALSPVPSFPLRAMGWLPVGLFLSLSGLANAQVALPQGGTVASGSAGISRTGDATLTINQTSDKAIVNWDSFSIGRGGHVDIVQPGANSAILNRVTGDTTSAIHGRLTATGQVHLVNPNGIFIGRDGAIDAGSFAASTLGISDDDFQAGRLRYSGTGNSATVENQGRVTIGRGGYAALIGGKVRNAGTVVVPMGRIGFAAGELVTLDVSGDQFLQVALPSDSEDDGTALIENSGTAHAEGGLIEMRAATARHAARHAINMSGIAEASSVSVRGGTIVLGGGLGGKVTVSGKARTRSTRPSALLVSESRRPVARGGDITVTGAEIVLTGADIDASGATGGGLVRIGGDFAGEGPLLRAQTLSADAATLIRADALENGAGGRVIVWSDVETTFAGTTSVRGGDEGGDGGFVEVSGKLTLNYTGFSDRRAPLGKWGMLLLDPTDVVIDPGVDETTLESNLAAGDVTVTTFDAGNSDAGDITVNADIDWTAATTLTLRADNDINLNGALTGPAGSVELLAVDDVSIDAGIVTTELTIGLTPGFAGVGIPTVFPGPSGTIDVGTFTMNNGSWNQISGPLAAFDATNFVLTDRDVSFLRADGGSGTTGDPFVLFDVFGLQGLNSTALAGTSFVLGNDIDASGTSAWTAGVGLGTGFRPINTFFGTFDGDGFAINGLVQDDIVADGDIGRMGLFGSIDMTASVTDLDLNGINFTGRDGGGLAAFNDGSVSNVRVSGSVTGALGSVGGIVGQNVSFGIIQDSIADVAVTGNVVTGPEVAIDIGGFVGTNVGTIDRSHATGSVTVTNTVGLSTIAAGGFAGSEFSSGGINDSYAEGDVSLSSAVGTGASGALGGFVGEFGGFIERSYSTGSVSDSGDAVVDSGGFAGEDSGGGAAPSNFWDLNTSGIGTSPTGTGITTAQFQDTETFIVLGQAEGWDFSTTWAPGDTGEYPVNYTTTPVILATPDSFFGSTPVMFVYGTEASASDTGSIIGGPGNFVFDEDGDTLDTTTVFDGLVLANNSVGIHPFNLATTSLTSTDGIGYRVVDRPGIADISAASLLITAGNIEKIYGVELGTSSSVLTATGLVSGDSVSSITISSEGIAATASVDGGPFITIPSAAVGNGLSNYIISFANGSLNVIPRPLDVTANDLTKTYGDLVVFDGTEFVVTGLVNDDTVTSVNLSSAGAFADAQVAEAPFDIVVSNLMGTGLENYDVNLVNGALSIDTAPLIVTADDVTKTYGETISFEGASFSAEGLLFEDTLTSLTLSSEGALAEAPVADSPYEIFAADAVGTGLTNYEITFAQGQVFVDPAPLTITANDLTKTYGTLVEFAGTEFTTEGLLLTDTVDSLTLASDGAIETALVAEGPFDIIGSDPVGQGLDNYTVTLETGLLSVDAAPLTLTADNAVKLQGEELVFAGTEFSTEGLLLDDTVASVTLNSDGAPAAALAADSPFGIEIAPGSAVGAGLENYDIAVVDGVLDITPPGGVIIPEPGGTPGDGDVEVPVPPVFIGFPLPNPTDSVTLPGDSALPRIGTSLTPGGPTQAITVGESDGPTGAADPLTRSVNLGNAEVALGKVEDVSETLEAGANACDQSSGDVTRYLACLSDALDDFADELDAIAVDLPPGMQNVGRIVQDARVRVNAARTRAQARLATAGSAAERQAIRAEAFNEAQAALSDASTEIRKAISLVRADDPELATVQRATIVAVADAVDSVGIKLSRAVEL